MSVTTRSKQQERDRDASHAGHDDVAECHETFTFQQTMTLPNGDSHREPRFKVSEATKLLGKFCETDVDRYLNDFERICAAQQWPEDQWCNILRPVLTGKSARAFSKLSMEEINDYPAFKKAILNEYELVSEV